MSSSINPHDIFVRSTFKQLEYAKDFLSHFLPKNISDTIDFQKLKLEDTSFIKEDFKELYSDILFEVPFKNGKNSNIYFLFEHKSNPDYDILLQLLKYQTEIYTKSKETIPIICLVFYHSEENWRLPKRFSEKMNLDNETNHLKEYILDFQYLLFDVELEKVEEWKFSVKLQIVLLLLKEVRKKDFDENRLKEILHIGKEVFLSGDGLELLKKVILYVYYTTNMTTRKVKNILSETTTEERTEEAMTTAEKLILEGEFKGRKEGKLEGKLEGKIEGEIKGKLETALNMIKLNIPEELIVKATGFSISDLMKQDKKLSFPDSYKKRRENHKIALKTALEMRESEFDIETIARITDLEQQWLKRFFKRLK